MQRSIVETQTTQRRADTVIEIQPAFFLELLDGARVGVHDALQLALVAVNRGIAHLRGQPFHLAFQPGERGRRVQRLFDDRARGIELGFLRQIADANSAGDKDRAFVRLVLAREQFQDRRLARAIRAHKSNARIVVNLPGQLTKNQLCAKILSYVVETSNSSNNHSEPRKPDRHVNRYTGTQVDRSLVYLFPCLPVYRAHCTQTRVSAQQYKQPHAIAHGGCLFIRSQWKD